MGTTSTGSSIEWAKADLKKVPHIGSEEVPCPRSQETHRRAAVAYLTIKMQRVAPGERNTWYLELLGTEASARFSTKNPRRLQILEYRGGEQSWQQLDMGHETAFKTITGANFEFGFSDAILPMWAAFIYEVTADERLKWFAGCVTPEETALSHELFTAALDSHCRSQVVSLSQALRSKDHAEYSVAETV